MGSFPGLEGKSLFIFSRKHENSNASLLESEEAYLEEKNENLRTGIVDFQILWKVAEGLITDYIFLFILPALTVS
jgi:hypothetical protein